jgi:hypothetical protein
MTEREGEKKKNTTLGVVILLVVFVPLAGLVGWVCNGSVIRPKRMTNELLGLAAACDKPKMRERFAPDKRRDLTDAQIDQWCSAVRGYESWEYANKATSMGTTRGGKATSSARGYLHYPGSKEERHFALSFIEIDGTWYFDSVTFLERSAPR